MTVQQKNNNVRILKEIGDESVIPDRLYLLYRNKFLQTLNREIFIYLAIFSELFIKKLIASIAKQAVRIILKLPRRRRYCGWTSQCGLWIIVAGLSFLFFLRLNHLPCNMVLSNTYVVNDFVTGNHLIKSIELKATLIFLIWSILVEIQ